MKRLNFLLLALSLVCQPAIAKEGAQIKISDKDKTAYLQQVQATLILSENPVELSTEVDRQEDRESSPSSPPMTTDDTGTPGPNGVEINLLMDCVVFTAFIGMAITRVSHNSEFSKLF